MGLITHNAAVTPAEAEHGHRRTYSLDTLERDAVAAGLKVVHRSGIFFKALANFQWDRLLQTDIISKEYLEGCYKLGQQYPDLCSSIFLVCERGRKHPSRCVFPGESLDAPDLRRVKRFHDICYPGRLEMVASTIRSSQSGLDSRSRSSG